MSKRTHAAFRCAAATLTLMVGAAADAGDLYGSAGGTDAEIIVIRTDTAEWASVGASASVPFTGLAYDPGRRVIYAISAASDQLYVVDPVTGASTPVGQPGDLGFNFGEGLAFDSAEQVLYATDSGINVLFTIDVDTGEGEFVAFLSGGASDIVGLAFDPIEQTLFGIDNHDNQIVKIDRLSGKATPLCGTLPSGGNWVGLSFDPDVRRLYATHVSEDALYEIDPGAGVGALIGALEDLRTVPGLAVIPSPVEFDLLGVSLSGDAYLIDEKTGSAELLGPTGFMTIHALARRDSDGLMLAYSNHLGDDVTLQIDPVTGQATEYGQGCAENVRCTAFAPNGDMYLLRSINGGTQNDLYRIYFEPPVCFSIWVGEVDSTSGVQGMDFAADGTLYGWSAGQGLIAIDPTNAAMINVNGMNDGSSVIQSLTHAPNGVMYGIHDELYEVDLETGEITLIGSAGIEQIFGMEWTPTDPVVPPSPADLDNDGDVDAGDLAALLGAWGPCAGCDCLGDLNFDLAVNAADLAMLLAAWAP